MEKNKPTKEQILNKLYPIINFFPNNKGIKNVVCPFHVDRKPSAHIYEESNSVWCFTCGRFFYVTNFIKENKLNADELYIELQKIFPGVDLEEFYYFKEEPKEKKEIKKDNITFIDYVKEYFK